MGGRPCAAGSRLTSRDWRSPRSSRHAGGSTEWNCYDVQVLAGLLLARGCVVEMQTGEGKTFASALPAFLFALAGEGVHVATPNAYLAGRDFQLPTPSV